jgi:hypothetical protein
MYEKAIKKEGTIVLTHIEEQLWVLCVEEKITKVFRNGGQ